ncbi:MAG: VCBS repeat-containing protein [Candidatus Cyclobacteriaceae bacterium M2_1C_046]
MRYSILFVWLLLWGCNETEDISSHTLFTEITDKSGVFFINKLTYTERLNPYTYRNFYNGAGVALGDINNDGLADIFFAGNQVGNKLYINKGDLYFEDVTEKAGVGSKGAWSTGVTFVDINADGLLDIYVCKSGDPGTPNRHNELFINNGDLSFTDKAKEYGLDVKGLSVHAAFFDYDKDGDLDCYLLTNSIRSVGNYDLIEDQRKLPDPTGGGNKFFLNENGKFIDHTAEAGIYSSTIGFGLGITLGDFNGDNWTDIFISNDFFERDYLYVNNKNGGFTESLPDYISSLSMGSMGADVADLDNDGLPELFVTEMLPDSLNRKKTKAIYENWDKYQLNVKNGYHHQFPRNVLHKKINDSLFIEVGRYAGLAATEWSWGALLFDMNNDGLRDIFVANGIYKDLLDRDYLTYTATNEKIKRMISNKKDVITSLVDDMHSQAVPNYVFENKGLLKFKNVAEKWGLGTPTFSNGSAYGDLDNDGDLDLVVNNINMPSAIYLNNTDTALNKSIRISLSAPESQNTFAVGSIIYSYSNGEEFVSDNFTTRGFQSSVDPVVHIGLGPSSYIDSIKVVWPEGGETVVTDITANSYIEISNIESKITTKKSAVKSEKSPFEKKYSKNLFKHEGSGFIDFNRDRLLPMMYSNESPKISKGDINNDGIPDLYIGGGKDQLGTIISSNNGQFYSHTPVGLEKMSTAEETSSIIFDANNDGHQDLYISSGGRFYPKTSAALMDQLFINDGNGNFNPSPYNLPFTTFVSTGKVLPIDFDNDGDMDLFIGERFHPFYYGIGGRGFLFKNDGKGLFTDVTTSYAPELISSGMITGAVNADINSDGLMDLIIIGDWMPVTVLQNTGTGFKNVTAQLGFNNTEGWWNDIQAADLNRDGKPDFVLANHGLNTFFEPEDRLYVYDFDGNGSVEQIYCTKSGDKYYPVLDKDELLSQLSSMKKQLVYYKDYADKAITDIIPATQLEKTKIYQVNILGSKIALSTKNGYKLIDLPKEAQYSPLYSLLIEDVNNDGVPDLVAGGNQYQVKPQFGRYDASFGWYFEGNSKGEDFEFKDGLPVGVAGQIRDIEVVEANNVKYLVFALYNEEVEIYEISN